MRGRNDRSNPSRLFHHDFLGGTAEFYEIDTLWQFNGGLAFNLTIKNRLAKQVHDPHAACTFHGELTLGRIGIDYDCFLLGFSNRKTILYQNRKAIVDVIHIHTPHIVAVTTVKLVNKGLRAHVIYTQRLAFITSSARIDVIVIRR